MHVATLMKHKEDGYGSGHSPPSSEKVKNDV
jgi:hypothetical protein